MTLTSERTRGTEDLDAEVLFEEARVLRRRRWARLGRVALVAAIGIAVGLLITRGGGPVDPGSVAGATGPGALVVVPGHAGTAAITLPSTLPFSSFTPESGHLVFSGSGENQDASACLVGTLDLASSRLSDVDLLNATYGGYVDSFGCDPAGRAPTVVSNVSSDSGQGEATVRVMTGAAHGRAVYGPAVLTYSPCSTCDPRFTEADGSIWVFAPGRDARVLRLSPTSGRVLNTIPIASQSFRPLLAADADGLWITFFENGGYGGSLPRDETPLIHIAAGSNVAEVRTLPGYAATWMVAKGHTLWLGTEDPTGAGVVSVFRFDGPSGVEQYQTRITRPAAVDDLGGLGGTVVGNESEGLWSAVTVDGRSDGANFAPQALGLDIMRIDPSTGAVHVVAVLHPPYLGAFENVGPGQIGIDGRDLYLLVTGNDAQEPSTLYRIPL